MKIKNIVLGALIFLSAIFMYWQTKAGDYSMLK